MLNDFVTLSTHQKIKKRVDTMEGKDIGMAPIKRRPRAIESDDNDDE